MFADFFMWRLQIKLTDTEHNAIATYARDERRDTRRQIEFIVRSELVKRGLLPPPTPPAPQTEVQP